MGRIEIKNKTLEYLHRDYYEYFNNLVDEDLKAGYETLILDLLLLAEIPKKECSIKWEGSFDDGKKVKVIISNSHITLSFELNFQGEAVDLDNLLKGLNKFIKLRNPNEKRKLQELQIYDDQTGCVWFVTNNELRELCPLLHNKWNHFEDHLCTVTVKDAFKKSGIKWVRNLYKRTVERIVAKLPTGI
ncbi:hypothetical protein HYX00_00980 [Candidatus Woesearchaeota archaeon]|nr:hypothetical protein [Candidatus Woesearchaeota archaeon]